MNKSDYEKAAEIVKPYQTRINFILEELRENMVEAFGNSFNSSSFSAHMAALFYDTSENATVCGFKFDFHDDSFGDCYEKCFDNGIRIAIWDSSKAVFKDGDENV